MSYAELAEVRRIDALKLAIQRGWPRQKNNHGQMQVCVPLDWAQPPERWIEGRWARPMAAWKGAGGRRRLRQWEPRALERRAME
jgi:hypothetical protein